MALIPHPRTVTEALAGELNQPEAYAEYAPYARLTTRFLGEPPSFYPLLSLSPAAMRTHVGMFARMFHVPGVDMRLPGWLPPQLRRATFLAASSAFGCSYCTAHACVFGDLLAGSRALRVDRGGGAGGAAIGACGDAEGAVRAFAVAAVARPEGSVDEVRLNALGKAVAQCVGRGGLEIVTAIVAFAGALNTLMDVQGVKLEPHAQAFAADELASNGKEWSPGEYHGSTHAQPSAEAPPPPPRGALANIRDLLQTLPAAAVCMHYEVTTLYAGLPSRAAAVQDWAEARVGARGATFLKAVRGVELRRAFCFGLRENFCVPRAPDAPAGFPVAREWAAGERARVLYVFAETAGSPELAGCAVELARRAVGKGVEEGVAARELAAFAAAPSAEAGSAALVAARKVAVASATRMENLSPELVAELTGSCTPEAVVELASLLSFAEMWRRMILLFSLPVFDDAK